MKNLFHNGKYMAAVEWTGVNIEEITAFAGDRLMKPHLCMGFTYLFIYTPEGISQCNEGDMVAKDNDGNLYVISENNG